MIRTKTTAMALAAILVSGAARSEEVPDQIHAARQVIRTTLLGKSMWAYEWRQPPGQVDAHGAPGKVNSGKAWFEEKDGKLIGYLDDGWKCDSEVKLRADGFDMETCADGDKQFVRNGNEFKATLGSYVYTIRPMPRCAQGVTEGCRN
jgi:hypothetical protein